MSIAQFRERVTGRDLKSQQSVDEYVRWIERFQDWHDGSEITEAVLRDFDDELSGPNPLDAREDPYSHSTRTKALSAVIKWAQVMENTTIARDVGDLTKGDRAEFDPTILDRDEVGRILTEPCRFQGCLAARVVGYDAIMRASEVTSMQPEDVDFEEGTVYVRAKKGSERRWIGVDEDTLELLRDQVDWATSQFQDPAKLFYNSSMVKGWSAKAFSKHFIEEHHDAGFHSFARHTAITLRLEDGEDFWDVYLRARHKHPSMTARYASIAGRSAPEHI